MKTVCLNVIAAPLLLWLAGCGVTVCPEVGQREILGTGPQGRKAYTYMLVNAHGMTVKITNYGGIVTQLFVPDRNGNFDDVVLGYNNLEQYIEDSPYFGALIGRYGNRIGGAEFTLDGVTYELAANDGPNHLHGGIKGFDKVFWDAEVMGTDEGPALKLTYLSEDGEEGYPGSLHCTVIYTLTNDNELVIDYRATTDKATPVNLTHHSYFNLTGCKRDILGHRLMINADKFTPVDQGLIPTGEILSVKGTPMDFTEPHAIGARIDADYHQLEYGGGYDHNWVLNKKGKRAMSLAARVYEPSSGRLMKVFTTEPGLQFYSGNFLDGSLTGKYGKVYEHRYGFCLETQHFPDSPNKPQFPSTILRPGETYKTRTIYRFSVRK